MRLFRPSLKATAISDTFKKMIGDNPPVKLGLHDGPNEGIFFCPFHQRKPEERKSHRIEKDKARDLPKKKKEGVSIGTHEVVRSCKGQKMVLQGMEIEDMVTDRNDRVIDEGTEIFPVQSSLIVSADCSFQGLDMIMITEGPFVIKDTKPSPGKTIP